MVGGRLQDSALVAVLECQLVANAEKTPAAWAYMALEEALSSKVERGGSCGLCAVEVFGPCSCLERSTGGKAHGDGFPTTAPERENYPRSGAT